MMYSVSVWLFLGGPAYLFYISLEHASKLVVLICQDVMRGSVRCLESPFSGCICKINFALLSQTNH